MTNLKNKLDPLNWSVPIVTPDGRATPELMRKWAQQVDTNSNIPDLTTAAAVSKILDEIGAVQGDVLYRDTALWKVLAPGAVNTLLVAGGPAANPAWDTLSALIDAAIGSTRGALLARGAGGWVLLAPGTNGYVLTMGATDPAWAAAAAGGGGAMLPLTNGDTPGPGIMADDKGQCIGVPL